MVSAAKKSLALREREVAIFAGQEVRCYHCGSVPEYYVNNGRGCGVRFWCRVCEKSVVIPKGCACNE